MRTFLTAACFALLGTAAAQDKLRPKDLADLKSLMTGRFSSAAQSQKDTNFYNISLRMEDLGSSEKDFWLYVEQAMATAPDRPYRQRLYHVYQLNDTAAVSVIYEFKEPKNFTAAWEKAERKKGLQEAIEMTKTKDGTPNLILRQGCNMYLRKRGDRWLGSTAGNHCTSNLRGAAYATSEALITKEGLVTLDRGFNAEGKQVWGSERGGYRFLRQ